MQYDTRVSLKSAQPAAILQLGVLSSTNTFKRMADGISVPTGNPACRGHSILWPECKGGGGGGGRWMLAYGSSSTCGQRLAAGNSPAATAPHIYARRQPAPLMLPPGAALFSVCAIVQLPARTSGSNDTAPPASTARAVNELPLVQPALKAQTMPGMTHLNLTLQPPAAQDIYLLNLMV